MFLPRDYSSMRLVTVLQIKRKETRSAGRPRSGMTVQRHFFFLHFQSVNQTMSKKSTWRRLCCACGHSDDTETTRPYEQRPRRRGALSRVKSNHHTWTRRSLLDNEQINDNRQVPLQCMAYQMRSTETNIPVCVDEDGNIVNGNDVSQFSEKEANRKRTARMFNGRPENSAERNTTFPWMDESFNAPSVRSGTRLGISSVQINARRRSSDELNASLEFEPRSQTFEITSGFGPCVTDGLGNSTTTEVSKAGLSSGNTKPEFSPTSSSTQIRTVPYTNSIDIETTFVPTSSTPRSVPSGVPGVYQKERPVLYKAPISDVGVRFISSNLTHTSVVPEQNRYASDRSELIQLDELMTSRKARPSVLDLFPQTDAVGNGENEDYVNVSFASEIKFRKNPNLTTKTGEKGKEECRKLTGSKKAKQERLKTSSTKGKGNKRPELTNRPDSMYGYVPRAVQDVRASNLLEGSTIDDFFKMRQNLQEKNCLKRIPYIEEDRCIMLSSESESETDEPIVSPISDDESCIITEFVDAEDDVEPGDVDTVDSVAENKDSCTINANANENIINQNLRDLHLTTRYGQLGGDSGALSADINIFSDKSDNSRTGTSNGTCNKLQKSGLTDENENKVIMIDFPPNLKTDRNVNLHINRKVSNSGSGGDSQTFTSAAPVFKYSETLY